MKLESFSKFLLPSYIFIIHFNLYKQDDPSRRILLEIHLGRNEDVKKTFIIYIKYIYI